MKRTVRSDWSKAILVCAKCSKKCKGGFGIKGKQSLMKALRGYCGGGKGRKSPMGIIEVKCLGVCPKNAVVVINGCNSDLWNIVPKGTDMDEIAEIVGLTE
ncbi:(2Fe-2S) ferredoxin domain-containing protein [Pacificimonas sp. WHA3]|uniref:(2Fe-2S) ferredoxin domain-containing protein n=1 Tax=Pacificimonas pallii TaxID=2827236 RepID=A0ABS6SHE0_9SPHN|nr:(2Fe-2S) ferredoxin domain-containing protein [Pacificimonas pallii]MBV7257267.1 (2Fe-2S) ferredoxin domain-containing protein [Pacificimonas pallii]